MTVVNRNVIQLLSVLRSTYRFPSCTRMFRGKTANVSSGFWRLKMFPDECANVSSGRRSQVVRGGGDAGAGRVARVQRVGRGRLQRALAGGGGAAAARRLPRAAAAAAHPRPSRRRARPLRSRHALSLATSLSLFYIISWP